MDLGASGRLGEISRGGGIKKEEETTPEVGEMMGSSEQWAGEP